MRKEGQVDPDVRCNANTSAGGRCREAATHALYNGRQRQGLACDEHARLLAKEFPWLKAHPIPHLMGHQVK